MDDQAALQWDASRRFSTPPGGVEAELVDVGRGDPDDFQGRDVAGKIVMGDASARRLFASAVQAFGPNVIGVVLSGTGRDGAHGCQLIKANGGIIIAQDEETSAYFAMPKAAIDADAIDYVLPLNEIPNKITDLVKPGQEGGKIWLGSRHRVR